jgi:hypothetical protein
MMFAWSSSDSLELSYSRVHPDIPSPRMGHTESWDKVHAHIPHVKGDHRACPAINVREQLGITLHMPYTVRLFREGRMEVDTYWQEGGPSVYSATPKQMLYGTGKEGREGQFVGSAIVLPGESQLSNPLVMFTLGDIRVHAWIFDSGVHLHGLPLEYTLLITPLPNHTYPPGYNVGQALASPTRVRDFNLKIPIDFDLRELPPEQEFVQIDRGTPLVQYLPVRLPKVSLRAEQ